ncbi:serologically defined colon cancer antigen 8 homolog isoform X2 [Tenebrio molitor]
MEFRKKPDYADTAYREAVGRLRILLAETYTPFKRPLRELDSAGEDTDNQSLVSANSRSSKFISRPYYHYLNVLPKRYNYYPLIRPSVPATDPEKNVATGPKYDNTSAPPELMSFIEKQEDYIEQLEKESRFCREELSSLLSKVKDVISENENLHEKQKSNIMKSVFNHLETETETETEIDLSQKISLSPKKSKKSKPLEGPTIVFESRISELEAQLTQAKIDLRKALEENANYKKKVADGSFIDGLGFDHYKKQIESVQREKDVLQDTVFKLQNALSKIKDKENDTCDQVKRSLDVAEQAQYEKNAAELEIRRLKDELDRQHSKLRDAIADQSRRISDERSAVERRYTQQIEQLTTELGVQWETTNKLQLELDKQRRENADLRRELAQKEALLDGMKKDMQNKIMSLQSDIGVNGAEKGALEQQIATLQMTNERNERQAKQEVTRLQAEMQSLRQRLDRADADLIHSRRENIRFSEQVASLEKEIKLNSALNEEKSKQASSGEILALPPPKEQQEKQLSSLIDDMESKHAATVAELEGMILSQNQLMDKLSVECYSLTQKLEDASTRHKEEIRELQTNLNRLNSRLNQSQITASSVKDEDYSSVSKQKPAQPQDLANKYDPAQAKNLSRTNSKPSIQPENTLIKKVSEEKTPSTSLQQFNQDVEETSPNKTTNPQLVDFPNNDGVGTEMKQGHALNDSYDQSFANMEDQTNLAQNQHDQNSVTNNQMYSDSLHQYNEGEQYTTNPDQQYTANPDQQYMTDLDQQYITNSDQQYIADPVQEYDADPNQQYITDPDQQYITDPDQQYISDPNQQFTTDPNQQYSTNLDQQYTTDPNQQYATDPNQQYTADVNQHYTTDPNLQYETGPNQQYETESSNVQYSANPNDHYNDRQHQY